MQILDNINNKVADDIKLTIRKGSKLSIAAACFSIYAFQELKEELQEIEELRFIFTSPTFTTEKAKKEKREFYIPRLKRERSLYGTEFEIKLRNELTQKAVAKECAEWIRQKVTFKSNVTNENMMGFINLDDKNYMPINGFTTVDLGCERGNNAYNMVQKTGTPFSTAYIELFESLWNDNVKLQEVTDEVIDNITAAKFQMNTAEKAKIDADISRITIVNEVSAAKVNIADGEQVKSFFVLLVALKKKDFEDKTISTISKLIPQNMLLVLECGGEAKLATYHTKLMQTEWKRKEDLSIELKGLNMDAVWENIIVQIGGITVEQGNTLDEQIAVDDQRMKIQKEIDRLTKQAKNEKQPKKKFELAQQINKLKQELEGC